MIFPSTKDYRQITKTISYSKGEKKVLEMEHKLMEYYGYNFSQLHKELVRREIQRQLVY
jgi:hypothetical protein